MSLRFCKRPTWWHSNLPYTNADIEKPEQVECEIGGNKFTSYAAVMKDGKDVICGRVTSVLKDAIGFGDAFVDWAVNQTLEFLRNRIKSFEEYSPAELTKMFGEAEKARYHVAEEAAEYGTRVHELIEMYTHNGGFQYVTDGEEFEIDIEKEEQPVRNGVKAFLDFWHREGLKPVEIEVWLVCVELGIGGTLDLVARDKNNDLVLIDHKTSKAVRDKYLLQVGYYDMLWDSAKAYLPWPHYNERIKRAYILRLDKTTADFEVFPVFRDEAERAALRAQCMATLQTYRWLRETGKILSKFSKKGKLYSGQA